MGPSGSIMLQSFLASTKTVHASYAHALHSGCSRMSVTSADQRAGVQDDVISLRRASVTGVKDTVARIPGIGLMHADTIFGVPPVFTHLLTNLPAIYKIVVFVTVRYNLLSPIGV